MVKQVPKHNLILRPKDQSRPKRLANQTKRLPRRNQKSLHNLERRPRVLQSQKVKSSQIDLASLLQQAQHRNEHLVKSFKQYRFISETELVITEILVEIILEFDLLEL